MDTALQDFSYHANEIEHLYGKNIHLLKNPWSQTLLATLCRESTVAPQLFWQIQRLYQLMLHESLNLFFAREIVGWPTRMSSQNPKGIFQGEILKQTAPAITVAIARAGIVPSQTLMEELCMVLDPKVVRQDHLYMARKTDAQGRVIGTDMSGSKIGGGQDDAIVFFPDPMGATGGSLSKAISHYKDQVSGKARCYVALHLIVTPEYIKRMTTDHPDVKVLALRLDRGLSPSDVLASKPGEKWAKEKGLNEHDYIVPGAGGVGEILNNSYV